MGPSTPAAVRRSYRQRCGLAKALDLVGERWTLLLVRELLLGPKRYGELHGSLRGLTTNLLARRLSFLEAHGLVERVEERGVFAWALTPLGRSLEPAILELGRFGSRWLATPAKGDRTDPGWGLLALKRRYRRSAPFVAHLAVPHAKRTRHFELSGGGERLEVFERRPQRPQVTLTLELPALATLLFLPEPPPLAAMEREGVVQVEGDRAALEALLASVG